MIKCERNNGTTTIEARGSAMTLAADCCEIISAIYASVPPNLRQAFKASVLLAVNHKDSPMWSNERKFDGVSGCVDIGELKRQLEKSDEGGSSVTRVDLTKEQCSELASYLRGILNGGMGAGCFGKIEMLVMAYRALTSAEDLSEVSAPPIPPPLSQQNPQLHGAVRRRQRSSSARRWHVWRFIVGQMASPALRRWQSCVTRWTAKLSPRRCWAECWAGRGFR